MTREKNAVQVLAAVAHVVATLPGPGRIELFAMRRAGRPVPMLVVEVYGPDSLVAAGEVAVWELNQALAALLSASTQARRLTLRDDGRAHGGHLDVIADGDRVDVVATARDGQRRVAFATRPELFAADLNALVRHYLALTRGSAGRTLVLPGVSVAPARR